MTQSGLVPNVLIRNVSSLIFFLFSKKTKIELSFMWFQGIIAQNVSLVFKNMFAVLPNIPPQSVACFSCSATLLWKTLTLTFKIAFVLPFSSCMLLAMLFERYSYLIYELLGRGLIL